MGQEVGSHKVYVLPRAGKEIQRLPGRLRQRVRRAVIGLRTEPRPSASAQLGFDIAPGCEVWRLRLDTWRVVYLIDNTLAMVYVLAVRKRPPYRYEDLSSLVDQVG